MLLPEAVKCAPGRDLAASGSGSSGGGEVSQPALIGQSQAGFVPRCRARRGLRHLFVSPLPSAGDILHVRSCAPSLAGIGALGTTKKVSEEKQVSG